MGLSSPPGSMGPGGNNGLNHNHLANHGNQSNINLRLYATTNYPHQHQSRLYEYHTTTNTSSTSLASSSFAGTTGLSLFHDRMPTRTRQPPTTTTTTLHEQLQLPPAEHQLPQHHHNLQQQHSIYSYHNQQHIPPQHQQLRLNEEQFLPTPNHQQHPIHRPLPLYPFQVSETFREPYVTIALHALKRCPPPITCCSILLFLIYTIFPLFATTKRFMVTKWFLTRFRDTKKFNWHNLKPF